MNVYGADINNREVDRGRFDAVIQWHIISLLAFMPFAFFTRHTWSEGVIVAFLGVGSYFVFPSHFYSIVIKDYFCLGHIYH